MLGKAGRGTEGIEAQEDKLQRQRHWGERRVCWFGVMRKRL
jgi:hypothetical protein